MFFTLSYTYLLFYPLTNISVRILLPKRIQKKLNYLVDKILAQWSPHAHDSLFGSPVRNSGKWMNHPNDNLGTVRNVNELRANVNKLTSIVILRVKPDFWSTFSRALLHFSVVGQRNIQQHAKFNL